MYINELTFKINTEAAPHSFEVDDLIATTIQELNLKGYKTAFCCSGHIADRYPEYAYISFWFGEITPEELPDGWYWVEDGLMEYEYKSRSAEELELEIYAVMNELEAWARGLPNTKR